MTAHRPDEIHHSSIVFVGHDHYCDEEHLLSMQGAGLTGKVTLASVDVRVWAGLEDRERSIHEYTGFTLPAIKQIEKILRVIESHPEALCLVRNVEDIVRSHETGKSAVLIGFEGGKPIEQDLDFLHVFYRLGLRMMQLTWAGGNDICDRKDPPVHEGLTDFGRETIQEMNRLGVVIDPGHCSQKTFFQVMELSSRPVAVLHTAPSGAIPGAGDLSDEQAKAIAATGGVIGLHFFSHYLHPGRKATVGDLVTHMEYLAEMIGVDYIALGCDFFELTDEFRKAHGQPKSGFLGIPDEIESYDKLVNVTRELRSRGFSDDDIRKILGGNLIRMFRAVMGK